MVSRWVRNLVGMGIRIGEGMVIGYFNTVLVGNEYRDGRGQVKGLYLYRVIGLTKPVYILVGKKYRQRVHDKVKRHDVITARYIVGYPGVYRVGIR